MADGVARKQDGRAIFDAVAVVEGMTDCEESEQQELNCSAFAAAAKAEVDTGHELPQIRRHLLLNPK